MNQPYIKLQEILKLNSTAT